MNVERKKGYIHTLIHKYANIGKDYEFIKRVIPEMNDQQYKIVLARIEKEKIYNRPPVCLGSKRDPYYDSEEEMLSAIDFSAGKLRGWEKDQVLFKESVTLFPLYTYEE